MVMATIPALDAPAKVLGQPQDDPCTTSSTGHSASTSSKPIRLLVIDTGPIIKNDPPVSTLLGQADELYTIPSVISEIRDETTRTRVETTLLPFLKLRSPRPDSVKFVSDFARRTGDLEVLSRPDIHLIALTYELECERNGGDWRLRKTPTQKGVNGKPPERPDGVEKQQDSVIDSSCAEEVAANGGSQDTTDGVPGSINSPDGTQNSETVEEGARVEKPSTEAAADTVEVTDRVQNITLTSETTPESDAQEDAMAPAEEDDDDDSGNDSDGWITPSNLKKHQEKDYGGPPSQPIQKTLQAAILTSDYAMQNVSLRINLNLISPAMSRITRVKTWVLRCHGCFTVTRKMEKQFCPSCGQATLTRTSCSTDQFGNFTIHLKRNFQFNKRGNVYSVPKPVHGSANGKNMHVKGGGKNGWGHELILAEDQKEYSRQTAENSRTRYRDLMDEDYLPNILSGERSGGPGRIRVGAGRNANSKKR